MNTYGLQSIHSDTFNLKWHTDYHYPKETRDVLVTVLRVHNLTLNILGYIPVISVVSGVLRIGTGLLMCGITLAIGDKNAEQGPIIGHWYDEALLTGMTQIARGALEAFFPFGRLANAVLDTIGTVSNIMKQLENASVCQGCMRYRNHGPYADPEYKGLSWILHLA